ncbi:MAG: lipoprotein signal peptidase [Proteobacteria bacterium]|nr:lipoprotein signal peptidase [Pseudomonadota bacterium]MDE3208660.1 lipoprotein signal peptidase [Pseudomonadota bacterium]
MRKVLPWLALSALIIAMDYLSKLEVSRWLADGHTVVLCPYISFALAWNQGAAFSFLASAGGWQKLLFIGIAGIAALIILVLLVRNFTNRWFCFALSLILGGALGNMLDRLLYGHVIDFIQLHYGVHYWPTFNVADSAITIGAVLLIVQDTMFKRR